MVSALAGITTFAVGTVLYLFSGPWLVLFSEIGYPVIVAIVATLLYRQGHRATTKGILVDLACVVVFGIFILYAYAQASFIGM